MTFSFSRTGPEGSDTDMKSFSLSGELCVFHAQKLQAALFHQIDMGASFDISLADVTEVDTAGVQLLLAAKREASLKQCQVNFINHSEPLLEIIDLLNLSRDFGDPVLITTARQGEETL